MIDLDEMVAFLVHAWSGNNVIPIQVDEQFQSNPSVEIRIPPFNGGNWLPQLTGLPRWRLYRYTLFHESMHELMSPHDPSEIASDILKKCIPVNMHPADKVTNEWKGHMEVGYIMNIIEDLRVEKIGLRTYRGYVEEQLFRNEFALSTLEPYLNKGGRSVSTPKYPFEEALESFRRSYLLGSTLPDEHSYLQPFINRSPSIETVNDMIALATDVFTEMLKHHNMKDLNESHFAKRPGFLTGRETDLKPMLGSGINDSNYLKLIRGKPELESTSSYIEREYSSITGSGELNAKIDEASEDVADGVMQAGMSGKMEVTRKWSPDSYLNLMRGTSTIISRLQTMLRKWKVGWVEVVNHVGEDVDTDEYVLGKMGNTRGFYIDERQTSPRSRIAILVDMSSSISDQRENYLRAVGIIADSLNFVGTKFSLFAFDGAQDPALFSVVKIIQEPWSSVQKNKLAAVDTNGGTPLLDALRWVEEFNRREDYDQVIVITDGEPDNPQSTYEQAISMNRYTSVGIIGIWGGRRATHLTQFFTMWSRTGKLRIIHKLDELPLAFFNLVRNNGD